MTDAVDAWSAPGSGLCEAFSGLPERRFAGPALAVESSPPAGSRRRCARRAAAEAGPNDYPGVRTVRGILLGLAAVAGLVAANAGQAEARPAEVVAAFYRDYLDHLGKRREAKPELRYSQGFAGAVAENHATCERYADGVCGFGADGDVYLDSQEYEAGISWSSAGVRVVEQPRGTVVVSLNVYPSLAQHRDYYDKRISFRMTFEDGEWVVDDILYADGVSSRQRMQDENAHYRANPDPGSRHLREKPAADNAD